LRDHFVVLAIGRKPVTGVLTADQRAKLKGLMMARMQQWRERRQQRSDSDGAPAQPAALEERT